MEFDLVPCCNFGTAARTNLEIVIDVKIRMVWFASVTLYTMRKISRY